ncbi:MAG: carotenoid biosynthesis protein [Acidimicrobiales bacterium]|nr:carotenoid biosynthesis protein [Acidimicrobiales bacterium]
MTIVGAGVTFGVMAAAQIAIPLTSDDATIEWLSSLVVVAFFATSLLLAGAHWGAARALAAAAFVTVATLVVERLGSTTGFPFGEYEYTGALEPTVGEVPVIVPLAWFAMGPPALEVARRITRHPLGVVAIGAAALTAWDLFLDPQMVDNGYWVWAADGAYEGVPLTNYAGWLGVGFVVLAVVDRIRPADAEPSVWLLALYTWWAVMNTIGFLVFFGEPLVGVVGGLGMGSITALAWWRRG